MITFDKLEAVLDALPRLKIGLVGDLFLDRYLEIQPEHDELSVETGLTAYQVTRVRNSPGALGTVLNNLAALGVGTLVPLTVLGDDGQAYDLFRELARLPVETEHIIQDAARLTPTYTKPLRRNERGDWDELNRLDLRSREPISAATTADVLSRLETVFAETDGLIVLDQVNEEGWGVVNPEVRAHLVELSKSRPDRLIFVDSRKHIGRFRCGTLKPNRTECLLAAGRPETDDSDLIYQAATDLSHRTSRPVFCTLGEDGMLVVEPEQPPLCVAPYPVSGPIDIVGAGDSATSGIVSGLLAGASLAEAAAIGNLVASITIRQLGTTGTASPAQVRRRWQEAQGQTP